MPRHSTVPVAALRAASRSRYVDAAALTGRSSPRPRERRTRAGVGVGGGGSWSAGMNHAGREAASSPAAIVSGSGFPTVHVGARAVERHEVQVDDACSTRKERDRVARRRPDRAERVLVVRHPEQLGVPVFASRITTSVPNVLVSVAATNRPSGDHAGDV